MSIEVGPQGTSRSHKLTRMLGWVLWFVLNGVRVCVRVCVCDWACVSVRACVYVPMCVYLCVCVRSLLANTNEAMQKFMHMCTWNSNDVMKCIHMYTWNSNDVMSKIVHVCVSITFYVCVREIVLVSWVCTQLDAWKHLWGGWHANSGRGRNYTALPWSHVTLHFYDLMLHCTSMISCYTALLWSHVALHFDDLVLHCTYMISCYFALPWSHVSLHIRDLMLHCTSMISCFTAHSWSHVTLHFYDLMLHCTSMISCYTAFLWSHVTLHFHDLMLHPNASSDPSDALQNLKASSVGSHSALDLKSTLVKPHAWCFSCVPTGVS
jgi:hypothetical protein